MARVTVRVKSIDPKYRETIQKYETELSRIVKFGINDVRNIAVQNISNGAKSGTVRRDGHKQSAVGEYPATDTGYLISNINVIFESNLSGRVESNADYSSHLEFGTSKMGARPFLQPSLEQTRPKVKRMVNNIVRD